MKAPEWKHYAMVALGVLAAVVEYLAQHQQDPNLPKFLHLGASTLAIASIVFGFLSRSVLADPSAASPAPSAVPVVPSSAPAGSVQAEVQPALDAALKTLEGAK